MSTYVISAKYPEFINAVFAMGHEVIATDQVYKFYDAEQTHADMQILSINNKLFILKECKNLIEKLKFANPTLTVNNAEKLYPKNILLNCLYLGNKLYGNINYIDNSVKEYCFRNKIQLINVKQGYCRCSALKINEKAVITADSSIEKAAIKNGVEVLKISTGNIRLEGFNYGFIGGASGVIDNDVVFFGNIKLHPDYINIENFCKKHNMKIKILCPQIELTDIGGMVRVK